MKLAYFDCFSGASGDMILAALLDSGLNLDTWKTELAKLPVKRYDLHVSKTLKKTISATQIHVEIPHEHTHRPLSTILSMIESSHLSDFVKNVSTRIFTRLGEAEARIHQCSIDEIEFHEVGAIDAIIDIVGACIGIELLGIQEIWVSPLHLGKGFVDCAHGRLPVPPPAVVELLKGIPVYSSEVEGELVTPTGAAILSTLAKGFGPLPSMRINHIGYGAGYRDLPIPNVLRVFIGEKALSSEEEKIQLIETNIDDMNPQFYDYVIERLFQAGAKDVFLTPVIMKKSRPGIVMTVMAEEEKIEPLVEILLEETTTLGVRISEFKKRTVLKRETVSVPTPWGEAHVKIRWMSPHVRIISPEYDYCKQIAKTHGIPIQKVFDQIKLKAERFLENKPQNWT